jgi:putative peptide zinc metalloprotease protein
MIAANDGPELVRAKPVLALRFRVPILPRSVIRTLAAVFRPLFLAPVVVTMLGGLAALDLWLFFVHGLVGSARETLQQPELFAAIFVLTLLATVFHEIGHATACRYGGADPGRIGVGIYIVWPIFYNDVTDTYRLNRIGRLRTDLGGVYFDVVYALAMAGGYFLTGSEWLLLLVFFQQLDILFQFMPFLRLDGYYVVSDLTGVPDLFARIGPVLKSIIPGRGPDRRVAELKPWVRVVVTAWVLAVIPALLYVFGMLIWSAPQLYATAWDSFLLYYEKALGAFGDGRAAAGVADLIRIVLLVVPVVGVTLMFLIVGRGLVGVAWSRSRGKPVLRAYVALAALGLVGGFAVSPLLLAPLDGGNGPTQRAERANFRDVAVPEAPANGRDAPGGADGGRTPPGGLDRYPATQTPSGYASSGGASTSATASASAPAPAASPEGSASPEASASPTASASAPAPAASPEASASPTASASAPAPAASPEGSSPAERAASPEARAAPASPGGGGRATAPTSGNVIIRQQTTQTSSQASASP